MRLFPIFADLKDRAVLVVGGGAVAERKVRSLLESGAAVTVGSLDASPALHSLHEDGRIRLILGAFDPEWLHDAWLIVAATDDRALNQRIAQAATDLKRFINVVDDAELSSFQVPSIVDRSPLVIAISSSGRAPVLARRVRERIEALFHHSIGALATLADTYRSAIREARPGLRERRAFYDWLLDGPVAAALKRRRPDEAIQWLEQEINTRQERLEGKVVLVGAGPGDPGLITLNALRALNEADVILYDRLVDPEILQLARRDATQISVGKTPGEDHEATQNRIHRLMLKYARQGRMVVRIKGGDPFVFGRGGEEIEFLRRHDVSYEIVPGITAALACAAYAGIPLTHRDHAQSLQMITAHCKADDAQHNWSSLARSGQTLAFYMGVSQLDRLANELMCHGLHADTPFAIIENGTRRDQRVIQGSLERLVELAATHQVKSPALLLVGEVTALAPRLQWYGSQVITTNARAEHPDERPAQGVATQSDNADAGLVSCSAYA